MFLPASGTVFVSTFEFLESYDINGSATNQKIEENNQIKVVCKFCFEQLFRLRSRSVALSLCPLRDFFDHLCTCVSWVIQFILLCLGFTKRCQNLMCMNQLYRSNQLTLHGSWLSCWVVKKTGCGSFELIHSGNIELGLLGKYITCNL